MSFRVPGQPPAELRFHPTPSPTEHRIQWLLKASPVMAEVEHLIHAGPGDRASKQAALATAERYFRSQIASDPTDPEPVMYLLDSLGVRELKTISTSIVFGIRSDGSPLMMELPRPRRRRHRLAMADIDRCRRLLDAVRALTTSTDRLLTRTTIDDLTFRIANECEHLGGESPRMLLSILTVLRGVSNACEKVAPRKTTLRDCGVINNENDAGLTEPHETRANLAVQIAEHTRARDDHAAFEFSTQPANTASRCPPPALATVFPLIKAHLRDGEKSDAIRRYCAATGCDSVTAATEIERIETEL